MPTRSPAPGDAQDGEAPRCQRRRERVSERLADATPHLERVLRRLMRLEPEAPNPSGLYFQPMSDGRGYSMEQMSDEQTESDFQRWHRDGRRGRIAEDIASTARRSAYLIDTDGLRLPSKSLKRLRTRMSRGSVLREIATARTFTWRPYHYATWGATTAIDGRLVLPSGRSISFDITCTGNDQYWDRESWEMGSPADEQDKQWRARPQQAKLPTAVLTDALLEVALRGWYAGRHEWKRGHWAVLARRMPTFVIESPWETDSEGRAETTPQNLAAGRDAEMMMREILEMPYSAATYAHFGQPPLTRGLIESLESLPAPSEDDAGPGDKAG